jgi:adenine-specific DNA-methyltransferase
LYIEQFEGESNTSDEIGYITKNYSPYNGNERMFFTVENARLIDFYRKRIEEVRQTITDDEYNFLLGTLLVRADAVSNVPAVYGCYLKNFKDKATKKLRLIPVHMETGIANDSRVYNLDVLDDELIHNINVDITYLDPPYNERQYSKNYFPLNMIAKSLEDNPELKGKTGIPSNCFLSPFCRKGKAVEEAFEKLFRDLKSKWIVLSYNSESIVSKEKMIELMSRYGSVSVIEREYKRFKSFEYNKNVPVLEYLFFLKKL